MKLGIDIGGTNITLGLLDGDKLAKSLQIPSFQKEWNMAQTIDYLIENIKANITGKVEGIGIGVPSVVDIKNGTVYDTANIPSWKEVPLKHLLEKELGLPVVVNNDSNCYALGAYAKYPADSKPESLVAMTLGTGVGMGIVINGNIFCGAHCGAGELACIPFRDKTLEDFCCKGFFTSRGFTPKEVYDAAKNNDAAAKTLFREFGINLGQAVCTILFAYDPEKIVIGGGVAKGAEFFSDTMYDFITQNFPYHKTTENLRVDFMTDDNLPVIGAASLVQQTI